MVTLGNIIYGKEPYERLITHKLPIKASYWLAKMAKQFNRELELYSQKRLEIFVDLGEKNENGEYVIIPGNGGELLKRMEELEKIEIDWPYRKLKVEELGNIEISASDLLLLEFLFDESELEIKEEDREETHQDQA